jgi:hypothetical protein
LAKPDKAIRVLRQARGTNAGDCKKMKEGSFAERKLFDNVGKGLGGLGPMIAKMNQDGFDLYRVN